MILFKVYVLVGFLSVFEAQTKCMPNLLLGEYRLIIKAIYQCDRTKDLPIKMNTYLSKKSFNSTEMRGNFSLKIPFEDSYIGTHESSGFDTSLYEDNNFPKVYFYGKYKFVGKIKDKNNKVLACIVAEVNLMRPWESLLE